MITLEFSLGNVLTFYIYKSYLKQIVNIVDFGDFVKEVYGFDFLPIRIPLAWYLSFYDERSQKLSDENKLSRNVTNDAKEKVINLDNQSEKISSHVLYWSEHGFD